MCLLLLLIPKPVVKVWSESGWYSLDIFVVVVIIVVVVVVVVIDDVVVVVDPTNLTLKFGQNCFQHAIH